MLNAHPISLPRMEFLGIYPTTETLVAQLVVVAIAFLGFWLNGRAGRSDLGAPA